MKSWPEALLCAAGLLATAAAQFPVTCKSGAHVIVVRASNEPPGYGILKNVSDTIVTAIYDSDSIAVPYPATIFPPDTLYIDSEPQGVGNLTRLIKQYGDACPDGRMALLGYSQGAHVIGDALIGSDYDKFPAFPKTEGIEQKYIDKILAVVMMGDPANVAGQSFLVGNSTRSGFFPRNNTEKWASTGLAKKMVSYCDSGDTYCDSGNKAGVHSGYVPEYGKQAADFVALRFLYYSANHPDSSSNATASLGASSGATSRTGLFLSTATGSSTGSVASSTATGLASQASGSITAAETSNVAATATSSAASESSTPATGGSSVTHLRWSK